MSARVRRLAVASAAALAVYTGAAAAAPPAADAKLTPFYVGVSECVFCHDRGRDQRGGPPVVCTCREAGAWLCRDKHQDAFAMLDVTANPRAARMAEILWPGADPKKDGPQQRRECLSCHSTPGFSPPKKDDPAFPESFRMEDGVGCVACHGAFKEWIDPHGGVDRAKWRMQTRAEKEAHFGMTDLWDPARRVEVCGSCHVGDRAQNKVVTHEMYAAGHPPLSGFEVGGFCERQPRHWQLLAEKEPKARELLGYKEGEYARTRLVVVGAAAEFRQAMRLLAAEAADAAGNKGGLDFAQMDCAACHHDLRVPSWRQARGYAGRPGRPAFRSWPLALLPLAALPSDDAEGQKQFARDRDERVKRLYDAFDKRPYGEASDVAAAALDLADWADGLTGRLNGEAATYNRDAALAVLRQLARLPAAQEPDYDAARQNAWAFRVVYDEVYAGFGRANDEAGKKTFEELKKSREQVQARLAALEQALDLALPPPGEKAESVALPPAGDKARDDKLAECLKDRRASYEKYAADMLTRQADYQPQAVREAFADLAKLLP